ncbi:hypothetical protein [Sphingomonas faeni]|uniref:hypothetical protein n=1 Tax=Sphingomonas faeni TaxID=185950 RepID=UPI003364C864
MSLLPLSPAEAQTSRPQPTAEQGDDEQPNPQPQQITPYQINQVGRIANSAVGQIGQRQTRESTATETGIKPTARLVSRIQNRVQNRIRNRIDRDYDPEANATNLFKVAEEQARVSNRQR